MSRWSTRATRYFDSTLNWLLNVLGQVPGLVISPFTGAAAQVSVKQSEATVTLTGSTIVASGAVTIGATSSATASMHLVSMNGLAGGGKYAVAIGIGIAQATATTTLAGTTIDAGGDVTVTSSATTTAFVKARTNVSPGATTPAADNIAIGIAVAHTTETAHVIVDAGSSITSAASVKIDAAGSVTNFAWAQPTINEDGMVAVAFALDFDVADVRAEVHGTIDAVGGVENTFDAVVGNTSRQHRRLHEQHDSDHRPRLHRRPERHLLARERDPPAR